MGQQGSNNRKLSMEQQSGKPQISDKKSSTGTGTASATMLMNAAREQATLKKVVQFPKLLPVIRSEKLETPPAVFLITIDAQTMYEILLPSSASENAPKSIPI